MTDYLKVQLEKGKNERREWNFGTALEKCLSELLGFKRDLRMPKLEKISSKELNLPNLEKDTSFQI
jgi:hypothetical protein